jgi:hypothetical protein
MPDGLSGLRSLPLRAYGWFDTEMARSAGLRHLSGVDGRMPVGASVEEIPVGCGAGEWTTRQIPERWPRVTPKFRRVDHRVPIRSLKPRISKVVCLRIPPLGSADQPEAAMTPTRVRRGHLWGVRCEAPLPCHFLRAGKNFGAPGRTRTCATGSGGQSDSSTGSFWCVPVPLSWTFSPLGPSMSGP